ncbi:hypothetical protein [Sphingomonas sp. BK069]|uniref:hypothetical protein n=1 Tax=Sphingomonas sp. BK069 TaxID=2586979 RepID=UPI001611F418|nr:hypothetical protein [Sphingomonas sp. BK069]MBB3348405.1 hypothetical protein [Sphingomonas sp. BK069]
MDQDDAGPILSILLKRGEIDASLVCRAVGLALARHFDVQLVGLECASTPREEDEVRIVFRLHRQADSSTKQCSKAEYIRAHCELLERLQVPNGEKAIAIALHEHWSAALKFRFGDAAHPVTVKRWRTRWMDGRDEHRRPKTQVHGSSSEQRVSRRLRRRNAVWTAVTGCSIRDGYRRALAEINLVNSGKHQRFGKPATELVAFSYETFARDCRDPRIARRRCPRPGRR